MPYVIDDIQKRNPIGDFYRLRDNGYSISNSKGVDTMKRLLLSQYSNSVNLIEYYTAFFAEMDLLYEQVDSVYFGQFLETAVGAQLDVIGRILDQSRNVELPNLWFGFQGAPDVDKMADEALPTNGGTFLDENFAGFDATPLDDVLYRRVLIAKAICNNLQTNSVNDAYYVIQTLLGRVPATFTITDVSDRYMQLNLASIEVNSTEVALINYFTKYFVPNGVTLSISVV